MSIGMVTPEFVVASDASQNDACRTGKWKTELGITHPGATSGIRVLEDPKTAGRRQGHCGISILSHHQHPRQPADSAAETESWKAHNTYQKQNLPQSKAGRESQPDSTEESNFHPMLGTVQRFCACPVWCATAVPQTIPKGFHRRFIWAITPTQRPILCTADTDRPRRCGRRLQCLVNGKNPFCRRMICGLLTNDDGRGGHPLLECKNGNNLSHKTFADCPSVPK